MNIEQRLSHLENQLRTSRRRERCILALLTLIVCAGAAAPPPKEIRTERLVIVDERGRECGQLAAGPHGASLDLNSLHAPGNPSGFHAEAGELRISDRIHGDDLVYVGLLGTRCYSQLTVEPPASAQVTGDCSIALKAQSAAPMLHLQSGATEWGVQAAPDGVLFTPPK